MAPTVVVGSTAMVTASDARESAEAPSVGAPPAPPLPVVLGGAFEPPHPDRAASTMAASDFVPRTFPTHGPLMELQPKIDRPGCGARGITPRRLSPSRVPDLLARE